MKQKRKIGDSVKLHIYRTSWKVFTLRHAAQKSMYFELVSEHGLKVKETPT